MKEQIFSRREFDAIKEFETEAIKKNGIKITEIYDNSLKYYRIHKNATHNFINSFSKDTFLLHLDRCLLEDKMTELPYLDSIIIPFNNDSNLWFTPTFNKKIDEDLSNFKNYIKGKIDIQIPDSELSAILWLMIEAGAVDLFSSRWIKKYGETLFDDLDQYYDWFCRENEAYSEFEPEISMLVYYLMKTKKLIKSRTINAHPKKIQVNDYRLSFQYSNDKIKEIKGEIEYERFEEKMSIDPIAIKDNVDAISIVEMDQMLGLEFEDFISSLLRKMGYLSEVTKASGDQGIDIIAKKKGMKTGVQVKRYSSKVTNTAIQEVVAGLNYYDCQEGLVITNNFFTKSAIELAKKNDVMLWDRTSLISRLKKYNMLEE